MAVEQCREPLVGLRGPAEPLGEAHAHSAPPRRPPSTMARTARERATGRASRLCRSAPRPRAPGLDGGRRGLAAYSS